MSNYWVNLAKTGNPNGKGLPVWPVYNSTDRCVIELGDEVKATPLPHSNPIDFLSKTKRILKLLKGT